MENKKVYCSKCVHYRCDTNKVVHRPTYADYDPHALCMAPENIKQNFNNSKSKQFVSSPEVINEFNNCRWYCAMSEKEPETKFALSDIPYGPYTYQLSNKNLVATDLILAGTEEAIYAWVSTFRDILWSRDLYCTLGKSNTFKLSGSITNTSTISNLSVDIQAVLTIKDSGIIIPLTYDTVFIEAGETHSFDDVLTNISTVRSITLSENDTITIYTKITPLLESNDTGSGENASGETEDTWSTTWSSLVLTIS